MSPRASILFLLALGSVGSRSTLARGTGSGDLASARMALELGWELDPESVELLAAAGIALDDDSPTLGGTPLHVAASSGNVKGAEALLRHGVRIDARGILERTPLHLAAEEGSPDMVRLLLARGADRELVDLLARTPAHLAAEAGRDHALEELRWDAKLQAVSPTLTRADARGWTPLALAAAHGHTRCVERLAELGSGASTLITRRTPLHWACRNGDGKTIELLLGVDAAKNAEDAFGLRPADLLPSGATEARRTRLGSATLVANADLEELRNLAAREVGDPDFVLYENPLYTVSGLRLAVWRDGLVLFVADPEKPGENMRIARLDPKAVADALAACTELGLFDVRERFRAAKGGGLLQLTLCGPQQREKVPLELWMTTGIGLPNETSHTSTQRALALVQRELDALVPTKSLALVEVVPDSRLRGYVPGRSGDTPWIR